MDEQTELIPMLECRQPAIVEDNLVDLKQRVVAVMETVEKLPRTRENLPAVRKARAELNKYFNALETQRKLVKAKVMQPYTEAEERYKQLVKCPIEEADGKCRSFIEGVENEVKKACEDELREFFSETCQSKGIYWLPFEKTGIKVTMAIADQKELRKPKEQIRNFVQKVDDDLQVISGMEDSADILVEYEKTLDMATSIERVNSRKRAMEIMKETMENAKKRNQARSLMEQAPEVANVIQQPQEKKFRVTFTVTATIPRLRGLKAFLEGNHYEYQEGTQDGKQ